MRKMPVLLALALLGAIMVPDVASAHAAYKSSEPADRATVASPPSRVTAEFTEPLAGGSFLRITDACGDRVDSGDVSIVGYEMSVSMSGSRSGRYVVFYRAHSQLDPHVVEGTFTFTATSGSSCPSDEEAPAPAEDSAPRPVPGGGSGGASSRDQEVELAQGSSGRSGGGGGDGPASERRNRSGGSSPPGRPPSSAQVPNIVAPEEDEQAEGRSVYDDIPLGPFLVGLLLAALIGAGGGKIYAGIMGPRA